jgi:hypothetical protein
MCFAKYSSVINLIYSGQELFSYNILFILNSSKEYIYLLNAWSFYRSVFRVLIQK